jgi:hypothetical protein
LTHNFYDIAGQPKYVVGIFEYRARYETDLTFSKGDEMQVISATGSGEFFCIQYDS